MKLPTLYKRSTTGKISEWVVEVQDNKFRTISGFTDGEKVTSAWTECAGKNNGKSNATDAKKQAEQQVKALHKKKKQLGAFEDIKDIDNETYFEPMLAKKLEDEIDKLKWGLKDGVDDLATCFSQPKLDGIRCIVKADGMWTRNGKKIKAAPHIFEALKPLFEANPDLILDGELYADKLANDFNKIISLVRKTKPTAEDLKESKNVIEYHIYDLPSSVDTFVWRYNDLMGLDLPECCKLVETFALYSKNEIKEKYEYYMERGYEGQMIRLDGPYENKRSKYLLKDKQFVDDDFEIIGLEEGKGNMANKIGKLLFEINGKPFAASVNGGWEYLERLFQENNLIGKIATVKYFALTTDGIPRFPKVVEIRDYE